MENLVQKVSGGIATLCIAFGAINPVFAEDRISNIISYPNTNEILVEIIPDNRGISKRVVLGKAGKNSVKPLCYGEVYSDGSIKMGNQYSSDERDYYEKILKKAYDSLKSKKRF